MQLTFRKIWSLYNSANITTKNYDLDAFLEDIQQNKLIHHVSNHPVHIIDDNGNLSPTALIPFCDFGANMSLMGTKIDAFDFPVCNSFQPRILNDQLCYEVDPNEYRTGAEEELHLGLALLIDYNEERHLDVSTKEVYDDRKLTYEAYDIAEDLKNAMIMPVTKEKNFIYLGTIGKKRH